MPNITLANPDTATSTQKELFSKIQGTFGVVPNMFKAIGNSPAALQGMFGFFGALGGGKIGAKLGEQIAVLVADINRCEYCLAAHTVLGEKAGVSADALAQAQMGKSNDLKTQAALDFVSKLVKNRAQVTAQDVQAVRNAGFDDEEIAEILAHVALNIFTNYTNVAFDVPVDFPRASLRTAA
jgi:uncharacterized peroxidase-related enzyme